MNKIILIFLLIILNLNASQYKFAYEDFDHTGNDGIVNLDDLYKNRDTRKKVRDYYQKNIALDDLNFMKDLLDIKKMLLNTNNKFDNNYNRMIEEKNNKIKSNIIFIKSKLDKTIKENSIIQLYDINYKIIQKLNKNNIFDKTIKIGDEYIFYNNTFHNIFYLNNPRNETINHRFRYKNKFNLKEDDKKNIFILYLNQGDTIEINIKSKYNYFSYNNKIALFDEFNNEYLLNYKNHYEDSEEDALYNLLISEKDYKNYYYRVEITNTGLYYLFIDKNKIEKEIEINLK